MHNIKIVIVEDDLVISKNLKFTLEDLGFDVLSLFKSGEELLDQSQELPDVYLLDIELKGPMNGIELAKKLRMSFQGPIIFITSKSEEELYQEAKSVRPSAFLRKPIDKNILRSSIELAIQQLEHVTHEEISSNTSTFELDDAIFVKSKNRLLKIIVNDIKVIKANDIYALIVTKEGQFLVNYSLKSLEEKLSKDAFFRVHRSYIVNLESIEGIEDNHVLIDGEYIPIGKKYRDQLMGLLKIL
ncbi:LytTR family transcriptional regulator DNA-binding domain-containing protein [Flammeovirga yaeyamensis]|uniref:LytTR family transcriptional regulator DNA-binding domain-containing protein n=1 Tax=Flammeovirga yaeyamensis TaxID=367791 RepID=A0AAX1NBL2_9BACT|nr:response regulator transcription factor [Flammeovirga yaeyamensis]MBB3697170.1 DNA-binding LytR/AlgR family response regulator [Flammeovirga yaeyamensis]NMF33830.1 response regulator transcription factor [Flammeovirga yaeyamensis]QWG04906.1 LytTR family transcriptional regulator DNA-binding domain-containing protein [Flammeovirga yaeyamensis]